MASVVRIIASLVLCFVILVAVLFVKFVGWGNMLPVRVERSESVAGIHVDTLGEYPTTILHLRLENEKTHFTIWEIVARSGTPQLHELIFKEGTNPVSLAYPDSGTYNIVAPANGETFRLERGINYQLYLWREVNSSPAHVRVRFGK
jgi:hypothetical protein